MAVTDNYQIIASGTPLLIGFIDSDPPSEGTWQAYDNVLIDELGYVPFNKQLDTYQQNDLWATVRGYGQWTIKDFKKSYQPVGYFVFTNDLHKQIVAAGYCASDTILTYGGKPNIFSVTLTGFYRGN